MTKNIPRVKNTNIIKTQALSKRSLSLKGNNLLLKVILKQFNKWNYKINKKKQKKFRGRKNEDS